MNSLDLLSSLNSNSKTPEKRKKLSELKLGESAWIVSVGNPCSDRDPAASEVSIPPDETTLRLLEMGFLEGAHIELVHEAPFGGDPLAVRVRGSLIAIRRLEANQIEVLV